MLDLPNCEIQVGNWQPIVNIIVNNYSFCHLYNYSKSTGFLYNLLLEHKQDDGGNLLICDLIANQDHIKLLDDAKNTLKFNKRKTQAVCIYSLVKQTELPYWITPIFSYSLD